MSDVLFPVMAKESPDADGVVSTWFVRDGESVAADQVLAEVSVDKVTVEVPAPVAGTVRLLVAEEEAVRQGSPIARIG